MSTFEKYDLHCHSRKSDGALTPTELIQRAQQKGVTTLALTDHDSTAGLPEAKLASQQVGINLVSGIELSTCWQAKTIHIVGLGINPDYPPIVAATKYLANMRLDRAEKIAEKLDKKRIPGAMAWVNQKVGDGMITRTHFADFLVAHFHVDSQQEAFDKYLSKGKPAYVATQWSDMEDALGWIVQSGGVAVLAHPLRYKLTASWMKRLLAAFKEAGGQGIEVVTGRTHPEEIRLLAEYAKNFVLAGSVGSDFHNPNNQWVELGRLAPLPRDVQPIWELLS